MKICLINPPVQMNDRLWYPIGICYVAASLIDNGYEVEIIDIIGENLSRDSFKKRLSNCHADCFGVGGLIMALNNVIDITQMIADIHPDSFVFAGNTVGSTIPEILLKNSHVRAIVMGEGEITTVDLVDAVKNGCKFEDISGIAFKNDANDIVITPPRLPIENLDELPYPAWDLIPMRNYFKNYGKNVYPISSVRGCPFSCIFCCKTFTGYKVRSRSSESILNELMEVKKRFDIESFMFFDDLFLYNKKRALDFCKLKDESPLKDMEWTASARVDSLNEEIIKTFKKSNCVELGVGFESASQNILDFYNKKITIEQSQETIDICNKHSMSLGGASFMIGAPDESFETIKVSVDFCKKNGLRYEPHFVTPYPKTPLYEYAIQKGLINDEFEYVKKIAKYGNTNHLIINLTNNFTDNELYALKEKSMYFPVDISKDIKYYVTEGFKILKTDGLFSFMHKSIRHSPKICTKMLSPILHPKQEKYSNEWL